MTTVTFTRGQTLAFQAWMQANPEGFVTNWLLKGKLIVLHKAGLPDSPSGNEHQGR